MRKCQEKAYRYPGGHQLDTGNQAGLPTGKGHTESRKQVFWSSCSDYHIFKKLNTTKRAMEQYLDIVKSALDIGVRPRCHFEDITGLTSTGLWCPCSSSRTLMDESGIPIKIRACDTLGYGVPIRGCPSPQCSRHYLWSLFPCGLSEQSYRMAWT